MQGPKCQAENTLQHQYRGDGHTGIMFRSTPHRRCCLAVPGIDCFFIHPEIKRSSSDKGFVVSFPVGDLELLLCQGMSQFSQKESDLILRVNKNLIFNKAALPEKKIIIIVTGQRKNIKNVTLATSNINLNVSISLRSF